MGCDCCGPPAQEPRPQLAQGDAISTQSGDASCNETKEPSLKESHAKEPDDCCSADNNVEDATSDDTAVPDCCRGILAPCCDISCLDRLALRECVSSTVQGEGTPRTTGCGPIETSPCTGLVDGKACSQHRRATGDQYGSTLEAIGCICRALFALGLESCCETRQRPSLEKKRYYKASSTRSTKRSSIDTCSSTGSEAKNSSVVKDRRQPRISSGRSSPDNPPSDDCSKSCCAPTTAGIGAVKKPPRTGCAKTCCHKEDIAKRNSVPGACAGSCCKSTNSDAAKAAPLLIHPDARSVDKEYSASPVKKCADACCETLKVEPAEKPTESGSAGSCCATKKIDTPDLTCSDGCCSPKKPAVVVRDSSCSDGCCSKEPTAEISDISCFDDCCSSKKPAATIADPTCSDGCCPSDKPAVTVKDSSCSDGCCSSKKPMPAVPDPAGSGGRCSSNKPTTVTPDLTCSGGCCSEEPMTNIRESTCSDGCCPSDKPAVTLKDSSCSDGCCSSKKPMPTVLGPPRSDRCCSSKKPAAAMPDSSCSDGCCSSDHPIHGLKKTEGQTPAVEDLEKQGTGNERVVLSISGMTCTGCETKLNRTLATVPAVQNLKTSLVLSRAEFNINLRLSTVDEVIKHLERTTEFKCQRLITKGESIEVIVPESPSIFMGQDWPVGVTDIAIIEGNRVQISFDPKIVGARDLLEKEDWDQDIQLAPMRGDPSLEVGSKHVRHVGYATLLSAVLTIPVLVMAWAPIPEREIAYSSASLALATIVQVVIAGPFYPKALKALIFSRVIEMDLLIVLSTSAAYVFSVVSFGYLIAKNPLSTGQFFETSTLLVTLIMVGRYVAALARQRAVESISIQSLQAPTAILVDGDSGIDQEIDARLLQYGDVFKVLPDTRVPTDGTVITGSSEVDESMLTGESRPVEKHPKSPVIAGSINGSGVMVVRLTRLPSDNTINAIAAMVDEAKLSKPKIQDLADRVASYFVPVVVGLTILTFSVWVAVGMAVRHQSGSQATVQAITYAITVLIVSCPCAIGLAVPMVIVIASGVAAERGVIFKSADAIEVAYKASHVVFDKTGTLTCGKLAVSTEHYVADDEEASLSLLLGLISDSRHPVSCAVAAHLKNKGIQPSTVPEPKSLAGKGVETVAAGRTLRAGNSRWLNLSSHAVVQSMLAQRCTVFCFTINDALAAVYGLEDDLRADANETLTALQARGVSVHLVSGDDDGAVQGVATKLGIPEENVRSRSSPADKRDYIQSLLGSSRDHKKPVVIFCGDGTNDAVALAQATIGVHINEGTDVAQSAADVVLMRPAVSGIVTMMNASRASVNRIKFNFAWSFVYNIFAVLLAAGAFVKARIPPEFAGLGELVSVLPVIAAAVLLRWTKI
ncbi:E1-E2 ATPase-domain-containing protein [Dactylonectria macrodidyma]|uniref:E1-E2 ATPase-domain-containing protein n=1 Tax=Dactylonectria macrodidyma TaxID=307937 RepID=A0A9P9E9C6_9HYPO|nr:E1-E2 ATPase-domain-containing protein [Dactylonectria macrodidyma]